MFLLIVKEKIYLKIRNQKGTKELIQIIIDLKIIILISMKNIMRQKIE